MIIISAILARHFFFNGVEYVFVSSGTPELGRLESSRADIFRTVRSGFAAAYDGLVSEPHLVVNDY